MTTIAHDTGWGAIAPLAGIDNVELYHAFFPRAPGCGKLMDISIGYVPNLKYYVRAHSYTENVNEAHIRFACDTESVLDFHLPISNNDWDHASSAAHIMTTYPNGGHDFTTDWHADIALPSHKATVGRWMETGYSGQSVLNGVEVGVRWDDTTCPSEDVPLWDWSSPAISETQEPASSVVVMKALCETYNRLIYGSTWMIAAAIPHRDA